MFGLLNTDVTENESIFISTNAIHHTRQQINNIKKLLVIADE